jgi:hypothetical protein
MCNRLLAIALGQRGLVDQAITFWHRVEEARLHDEEPTRIIEAMMTGKVRAHVSAHDSHG